MECLVIWDTGINTDLWPSFHIVGGREDNGRRDKRHQVMSVEEAGGILGNLRGTSGCGLPYTPRPDLVLREMGIK